MSRIKAQVSVEFLMIFILMVLIFSIYVPYIWERELEIEKKGEFVVGRRIASNVKSEVELAVMFGHGYRRNFTLPADILGSNYSIDIRNKVVVVKWKDYEVHELLIAHKITGSPKPGKNTILNRRDEIVFQ